MALGAESIDSAPGCRSNRHAPPRPAKRRADPTTDFAIAEFRNDQRQTMLGVQEFC